MSGPNGEPQVPAGNAGRGEEGDDDGFGDTGPYEMFLFSSFKGAPLYCTFLLSSCSHHISSCDVLELFPDSYVPGPRVAALEVTPFVNMQQ
ncbi:bublin coiled-coil protein isoform X2 [Chelonia mydas]|uniref:bublin coiled-coil protein isoform X2 n=1 Tax=Chelonia mydas TaxID=8469 RepID=UPI0018A1FC19|nr:bublin coiled-coil protein isoform X2 [Chelonia mydas]